MKTEQLLKRMTNGELSVEDVMRVIEQNSDPERWQEYSILVAFTRQLLVELVDGDISDITIDQLKEHIEELINKT